MATVAKTDPGTTILWGEDVFQFEDGTRQVTEAEKVALERYMEEGGPFKITFEDTKAKKTDK